MKKNYVFIISSGILLFFAFAPIDLYYLAFTAFIPLFFIIEKEKKGFFKYPFLSGVVFYLLHLSWLLTLSLPWNIKLLLIIGWILLAFYMALVWGVSFYIGYKSGKIYLIPFLWAFFEFIRGELPQIGFPWGSLGYSQVLNLPVLQIASIGSIYAVSFFVLLINLLFFYSFRNKKILGVTILIYFTVVLWGNMIVKHYDKIPLEYNVALLQGNIDPEEKNTEQSLSRWKTYFFMTLKADSLGADLIVWPETAYPGYIALNRYRREKIQYLCDSLDLDVLMGSLSVGYENNKRKYYNSAYLFSSNKEFDVYHKINLVPFGEHIPYDNVFPFLRGIDLGQGNFSPGKKRRVLGGYIGVLICFESIFVSSAHQEIENGAKVLINITEDSWFDKKIGPTQHFRMAIPRAVENRRYLLRSANTGISAVISPSGRIIEKTQLFDKEILFYGGRDDF